MEGVRFPVNPMLSAMPAPGGDLTMICLGDIRRGWVCIEVPLQWARSLEDRSETSWWGLISVRGPPPNPMKERNTVKDEKGIECQ